MKASSKRVLSLLLSIILIAAAFFGFFEFVKPEIEATKLLRADLEIKSKLYSDYSAAVKQVGALINKNKTASGEVTNLSIALPMKEAEADIINQLFAIAQGKGVGITFVGLSYLPVTPTSKDVESLFKGYGTLKVAVKVSGSYDFFKNFLESVESNMRIMNIDTLKVTPIDKTPNFLDYDLVINTYYQLK